MGRVPAAGAAAALSGAGIDAERVERFGRFLETRPALLRIWSERELEHARGLESPALGLAASFCCKEALLKALGGRFPFGSCEVLLDPRRGRQELLLEAGLLAARGVGAAEAALDCGQLEGRGELLAVVTTHPEAEAAEAAARSSLLRIVRSLPIAEVAAARDAIAAENFSPEELERIAPRPLQTVAGFLALKRALADLWAGAWPERPARPRDFRLAHLPSGAPHLASSPPLPAELTVAVSVSHTSVFAYGLAVLGSAAS